MLSSTNIEINLSNDIIIISLLLLFRYNYRLFNNINYY